MSNATGYSFVTARVNECLQQYGYGTASCTMMEKWMTSNRLQQATARGAVLHRRTELFDAFRAVTSAVTGGQPAQFAMGTLRKADNVLLA